MDVAYDLFSQVHQEKLGNLLKFNVQYYPFNV